MNNIFQDKTLGFAYLNYPKGEVVYLEPRINWGVEIKGICELLQMGAGCGSIQLISHPDGWFPIMTWLNKVMGVFIPLAVLQTHSTKTLELSIQRVLYPESLVILETARVIMPIQTPWKADYLDKYL